MTTMKSIDDWYEHFNAPWREIKNQLEQKRNLDTMMEALNPLVLAPHSSDVARMVMNDITHWYSMSTTGAIRRLVDKRRGTYSIVRFLLHIKRIRQTDLDGVIISPSQIDEDVRHVETIAEPAVTLANNLVAHRSSEVPVTMVPTIVHAHVPHPTYGEIEQIVVQLDALMVKYGRMLYANGIVPGVNEHRLIDAKRLHEYIFRDPPVAELPPW